MANGALQPSLFDSRDIAEITCPELYPGERLVVCHNPQLAAERARKRQGCWRPRVWTPPLMQAVFGRLGACGQVLSCVRPLHAADHTPRARMEIRGLGPNHLRELESSPFGCWFSRPGLVDLCPYLSSDLTTSPTAYRTSPFSQAVAEAR